MVNRHAGKVKIGDVGRSVYQEIGGKRNVPYTHYTRSLEAHGIIMVGQEQGKSPVFKGQE